MQNLNLPSFEGTTNHRLTIWAANDPFRGEPNIDSDGKKLPGAHRELCKICLEYDDSDGNPMNPIYFNIPLHNGCTRLVANGANNYAKKWDKSLRKEASNYYKSVWALYRTGIRDTKYAGGWVMQQWGDKRTQSRRVSAPFVVCKMIRAEAKVLNHATNLKTGVSYYIIDIQMGHTTLTTRIQAGAIDNAPFQSKGITSDPIASMVSTILKESYKVNKDKIKEILEEYSRYYFDVKESMPDNLSTPQRVLEDTSGLTLEGKMSQAMADGDFDTYNALVDQEDAIIGKRVRGTYTKPITSPQTYMGRLMDQHQRGEISTEEFQAHKRKWDEAMSFWSHK